jgi:hypothetical protein
MVQITAQKSFIIFAPISEKVSSEKDQLIQKKNIFIFTSWNWLLPTKQKNKKTIITSFL